MTRWREKFLLLSGPELGVFSKRITDTRQLGFISSTVTFGLTCGPISSHHQWPTGMQLIEKYSLYFNPPDLTRKRDGRTDRQKQFHFSRPPYSSAIFHFRIQKIHSPPFSFLKRPDYVPCFGVELLWNAVRVQNSYVVTLFRFQNRSM